MSKAKKPRAADLRRAQQWRTIAEDAFDMMPCSPDDDMLVTDFIMATERLIASGELDTTPPQKETSPKPKAKPRPKPEAERHDNGALHVNYPPTSFI